MRENLTTKIRMGGKDRKAQRGRFGLPEEERWINRGEREEPEREMVIRFGGQEIKEVIKAWRKRRGREAVREAKAGSACTKYQH